MAVLWQILTATRDLGRLQEIGFVLARHGFADLVRRLGLASALEAAGRRLRLHHGGELVRLEPPQRFRRVLEELGPTFVKLGQLLAMRVDLFPPDWIAEFEKLEDRVAPVGFATLKQRLAEEIGAPLEEVFERIDETALGAGSLAQAHRAKLSTGEDVVLKIRRPSIVKRVAADLRLLARVAEIAEQEIEDAWRYRPVEICRQLERSLHAELDFAREGQNAQRIAEELSSEPRIVVPKVYWEWTTERLNVQGYVDGIPGRDLAAARAAGLDLKELAALGARAVLAMVLEHGFFHADPHPGNVFYLRGNRLSLIDFGMVGRLSEGRREELVDFLFALVNRDSEQISDLLSEWAVDERVDQRALVQEIDTFLDEYHGQPLRQLNVARMLDDFTRLLREHGLALPPDLALFFKVLLTLEGFGRLLDPDFEVVEAMRPFLEQALESRWSPREIARRARRNLRRAAGIVTGLPRDLHGLLRAARRGGLQLRIDLHRLDRFGRDVEQSANRITIGVVTAALIIGTAILMTVDRGPKILGLPFFGFLGFASSCALGLWLLWAMRKSGKR